MAQVHDAAVLSLYRAAPERGGVVGRLCRSALGTLRSLLVDGLTADAFLVLDGHESVAVLLRRPDGYVLVARAPTLTSLDGGVHAEPDLARDAASRALGRTVSLSPVWYS